MRKLHKTLISLVLSVSLLFSAAAIPITTYAYETDEIEKNSSGEVSRFKGRFLYSFDLKGQKLKPRYFDPTMLQTYSGWYTLSGLEGLDTNRIAVLLKIYNALIDHGYSEAMAAGACGNFWQECNFNPEAGSGGYGFAQWMGNRKTALINYASSKGKSWSDLDIQIEYLMKELNGSYDRSVNEFLYKYGNTSTSKVTNVDLAAEAFCAKVEGCTCFNKNGGLNSSAHGTDCAAASNGVWYQQLNNRIKYANIIARAITRLSRGYGSGGDYSGMSQADIFASIFGYSSKMETIQFLSEHEMDSYMVTMKLNNGMSITINKAIADDTKAALDEMIANGFQIKQLCGYYYRGVNSGKGYYYNVRSKPSYHAFGLAVDINWNENPQLSARSKMKDASGIGYTDDDWNYLRSSYQPFKNKYALTTIEYDIMRSHGFAWGRDFGQGSWPDIMHFSVGEVSNVGVRSWMSTKLETENRSYK